MKRLNIFSKIRLSRRAYRDVRNQAFYMVSRRQPKAVSGGAKPAGDVSVAVSPFIFEELAALKESTDYVLSRRPVRFWLKSKRGFKYFLWSTLNVVSKKIDGQRLQLTASISADNQQFKKSSGEIAARRANFEKRREYQMVQLCINQNDKLIEDYVAHTISKYKSIVDLLTQKLNILASVNDRLKYIRSKRFRRIRHYYLKAADYSENLPKVMPTDEDLLMLAGLGSGEAYADERAKTEALLDAYLEQINRR